MSPDAPTIQTPGSETWPHRLQLAGLKTLRVIRAATRAVADPLTKKLFLAAHEASDDAYWRQHAGRCEWRSLGGIIEYNPDLLAVPGSGSDPAYVIAIRAGSNTDLKRVTIKVKAKKSGIIHEQAITHGHLCDIPVRKALTAIPLKARSSKGIDWHRLGDIYIKLVEAVAGDGVDLVGGKKIADIFPSTSTDSAPHRHVERWGQYWSIDAIDMEKENIKTRYYRELVQSARQLGRPLTIRRAAYRLLTSDLGLALTFWSQNLFKARGIRASITQAEAKDRPLPGNKGRNAASPRNAAHPGAFTRTG